MSYPRPETVEEALLRMLLSALKTTCGNKAAAARILGVSPGTVRNMIRHYGLLEKYPIAPSTKNKNC